MLQSQPIFILLFLYVILQTKTLLEDKNQNGRQARIWGGNQRPDWMRGKGGRVQAWAPGTFCLHIQVQQRGVPPRGPASVNPGCGGAAILELAQNQGRHMKGTS